MPQFRLITSEAEEMVLNFPHQPNWAMLIRKIWNLTGVPFGIFNPCQKLYVKGKLLECPLPFHVGFETNVSELSDGDVIHVMEDRNALKCGETYLHSAVYFDYNNYRTCSILTNECKKHHALKICIERSEEFIDQKDLFGSTPLFAALKMEYSSSAELLLSSGSDPQMGHPSLDIPNDFVTPHLLYFYDVKLLNKIHLERAVLRKAADFVCQLIESGASLDVQIADWFTQPVAPNLKQTLSLLQVAGSTFLSPKLLNFLQ